MLIRENKVVNHLFLFFIGGFLYGTIEIFFRGYSHISMFIAGGACFVLIGIINRTVPKDTSLVVRAALATLLITAIEFLVGIIVNRWMGLGVWDYSDLPFNLMGQICLYFVIIWFFVAIFAILLNDYLQYLIKCDEKPKYKII